MPHSLVRAIDDNCRLKRPTVSQGGKLKEIRMLARIDERLDLKCLRGSRIFPGIDRCCFLSLDALPSSPCFPVTAITRVLF